MTYTPEQCFAFSAIERDQPTPDPSLYSVEQVRRAVERVSMSRARKLDATYGPVEVASDVIEELAKLKEQPKP